MCEIRVMSFNIRGSFAIQDGVNAWTNRAGLNAQTIKRHAPDVIGFQELQSGNLAVYREQLPEYAYLLGPETGNREPYTYDAIFWKASRFECLASGGFWLSRTPDTHSADWDTDCIRAAAWVKLRCTDTGQEFLHLNTHLDHVSEQARVEGSKLILQKIEELQADGLPVTVTGDFNCRPGSDAYRLWLQSGFSDAHLAAGNVDSETSHTFHGFQGQDFVPSDSSLPLRIDWILTRDGAIRDGAQCIQIALCVIVRDAEPPLYPSDHYPILAELKLLPGKHA